MTPTPPIELEELLELTGQAATLPTLYMEVSKAVEDPETSFGEIGHIIGRDPSLSGRLLNVVNSAFYGFSNKIETITHAIAVIGTAQLRDLVLATTIMDKFKGIPNEWLDMDSFWKHSIACGLAARIIGTFARQRNPERLYTIGILHDIGRLIMLMGIPEKMNEVIQEARQRPGLLSDVEKEMLGFDHGDVGCAVLKKWNLTPGFQAAVNFCHRPHLDTTELPDSSIIHLADVVVHCLGMGDAGNRYVPPLEDQAWRKCGLTPAMLGQVVSQLEMQMQEVLPVVM